MMISFLIVNILLNLYLVDVCPVCGKPNARYIKNYARFGDPIGTSPTDHYPERQRQEKPYYDKENLNKYTYDDRM